MRKICCHCGKNPVNRPRGLCWTCYYAPGVREQHPSTSKYARRGVGNFNGNPDLPAEATEAAPGSAEKIEILARRAAMRMALWHPEDASAAPSNPDRIPILRRLAAG
jgi:hypothetical protein